MGEHTEDHEGLAMLLAIDRTCAATARTLDEPVLQLRSAWPEDQVSMALTDLTPGHQAGWAGYVGGVVWALRRRGIPLPGLAIEIDSNVPMGAGLASSAALTCSVAASIDDLLGLALSRPDLLELTVRAKHEFVGAPAGCLDQLAALYGRDRHVLLCDMRSYSIMPVPFDLDAAGLSLLVIDTRISRVHVDGGYALRRSSCERAAEILGVRALRDVTALEAALAMLPAGPGRGYVRHVVTENARVRAASTLLRSRATRRIGPLMNASHDSLRDDFQVSCAELDLAVETLRDVGALGARMTGIGGMAIALLDIGLVHTATMAVGKAFEAAGYRRPQTSTVHPSRGAFRVASG
jgi:galactokinase